MMILPVRLDDEMVARLTAVAAREADGDRPNISATIRRAVRAYVATHDAAAAQTEEVAE
jgi:predicted transcriptional regulator